MNKINDFSIEYPSISKNFRLNCRLKNCTVYFPINIIKFNNNWIFWAFIQCGDHRTMRCSRFFPFFGEKFAFCGPGRTRLVKKTNWEKLPLCTFTNKFFNGFMNFFRFGNTTYPTIGECALSRPLTSLRALNVPGHWSSSVDSEVYIQYWRKEISIKLAGSWFA